MANDSGPTATPTRGGSAPDDHDRDDRDKRDEQDELDELRKEHARELRHEVEAERHRVCLAWLPVLDGLETVLEETDRDNPAAFISMRSVRDQAVALLASLGFPRDDEAGVPFDPRRHEIAELVDDPDVAPGMIVKVLRPGYGTPSGRQLRPAAVVVNREKEE